MPSSVIKNSLWVALYEKAYVQYHNARADSYATINGGWMSDAFSALGLKSQTIVTASSATNLITTLASDLKAGDFTTFGTVANLPAGSPLVANHAYEVNFGSGRCQRHTGVGHLPQPLGSCCR